MPRSAALGYNRRKSPRKTGCCSINFLKYILFIFNFLYLVSGCAVLGVGIWTVTSFENQIALLTTATFLSSAALLITAGVIVIITSLIGCCAIGKEDRCFLLIYTFSLLLVFLLEAIGGIMAYVYEEQIMVDLSHSLSETFNSNYGEDQQITNAVDIIQQEYKCCGASIFYEWEESVWRKSGQALNNSVPESCCKTPSPSCGISTSPSNIWHTGCIHMLEEVLGEHLLLLGAIGCGISTLQIIGLIFSCCLYVKLKDLDEDY